MWHLTSDTKTGLVKRRTNAAESHRSTAKQLDTTFETMIMLLIIGFQIFHPHSCEHSLEINIILHLRQCIKYESWYYIRHSVNASCQLRRMLTSQEIFLNERCLRVLVQALVLSSIDYCTLQSHAGLPAVTIHPLTTVFHAAANKL